MGVVGVGFGLGNLALELTAIGSLECKRTIL